MLVVGAPGPLQLGGQFVMATRTQPRGILGVREAAGVAGEAMEASGEIRGAQLVSEDRRERQRDVRIVGVEQIEQRQIAGGDRLPQPLLAERPGAEALDVGHVRVQQERERAALARAGHGRQTATKSRARSRLAAGAARRAKSDAAIAGVKRS